MTKKLEILVFAIISMMTLTVSGQVDFEQFKAKPIDVRIPHQVLNASIYHYNDRGEILITDSQEVGTVEHALYKELLGSNGSQDTLYLFYKMELYSEVDTTVIIRYCISSRDRSTRQVGLYQRSGVDWQELSAPQSVVTDWNYLVQNLSFMSFMKFYSRHYDKDNPKISEIRKLYKPEGSVFSPSRLVSILQQGAFSEYMELEELEY